MVPDITQIQLAGIPNTCEKEVGKILNPRKMEEERKNFLIAKIQRILAKYGLVDALKRGDPRFCRAFWYAQYDVALLFESNEEARLFERQGLVKSATDSVSAHKLMVGMGYWRSVQLWRNAVESVYQANLPGQHLLSGHSNPSASPIGLLWWLWCKGMKLEPFVRVTSEYLEKEPKYLASLQDVLLADKKLSSFFRQETAREYINLLAVEAGPFKHYGPIGDSFVSCGQEIPVAQVAPFIGNDSMLKEQWIALQEMSRQYHTTTSRSQRRNLKRLLFEWSWFSNPETWQINK